MGLYNRGKLKTKYVPLVVTVAALSVVVGAIGLPFFYIANKLKNLRNR